MALESQYFIKHWYKYFKTKARGVGHRDFIFGLTKKVANCTKTLSMQKWCMWWNAPQICVAALRMRGTDANRVSKNGDFGPLA